MNFLLQYDARIAPLEQNWTRTKELERDIAGEIVSGLTKRGKNTPVNLPRC